jgi:hypothetical protein
MTHTRLVVPGGVRNGLGSSTSRDDFAALISKEADRMVVRNVARMGWISGLAGALLDALAIAPADPAMRGCLELASTADPSRDS